MTAAEFTNRTAKARRLVRLLIRWEITYQDTLHFIPSQWLALNCADASKQGKLTLLAESPSDATRKLVLELMRRRMERQRREFGRRMRRLLIQVRKEAR